MKLFAGSVIFVLGIALLYGVDYPVGSIETYDLVVSEGEEDHSPTNTTGTITTTKTYENYNNYITYALATIFLLAGVLIFIFQPFKQNPVI